MSYTNPESGPISVGEVVIVGGWGPAIVRRVDEDRSYVQYTQSDTYAWVLNRDIIRGISPNTIEIEVEPVEIVPGDA